MKQNLVGRISGKIKVFVQDFVTIKTGVNDPLRILQPWSQYIDGTNYSKSNHTGKNTVGEKNREMNADRRKRTRK